MIRTRISCPYCKRKLAVKIGDVTLMPFGEPFVTCPYCNSLCKTGANYWCNMTSKEKAEAKAKIIVDGILKFFVLSALLYLVGFIILDECFAYEPPWWSATLIAGPVVYFFCRWNFNRLKKIKPGNSLQEQQVQ